MKASSVDRAAPKRQPSNNRGERGPSDGGSGEWPKCQDGRKRHSWHYECAKVRERERVLSYFVEAFGEA